jgi:hypothetical protein
VNDNKNTERGTNQMMPFSLSTNSNDAQMNIDKNCAIKQIKAIIFRKLL